MLQFPFYSIIIIIISIIYLFIYSEAEVNIHSMDLCSLESIIWEGSFVYYVSLCLRNCGWNAADHECFQHIMSQYSPSLRNQRSLYIDMLQRLLPHITQQEMVSTHIL